MANSADPDQLASSEANWSGSTLFAKQGKSGFSRTRVKKVELGIKICKPGISVMWLDGVWCVIFQRDSILKVSIKLLDGRDMTEKMLNAT